MFSVLFMYKIQPRMFFCLYYANILMIANKDLK